jgi:hypothetical protein
VPERRYVEGRLSRRQQVSEALNVLDSPVAERKACRAFVAHMLDLVDRRAKAGKSLKRPITKEGGRELGRLRNSFKRALADLESTSEDVKPFLASGPMLRRDLSVIDATRSSRKAAKHGKDVSRQKAACDAAFILLQRWRPGERLVTTRTGKWARLSAIMYGDLKADLYQHLRKALSTGIDKRVRVYAVNRQRRRGAERLVDCWRPPPGRVILRGDFVYVRIEDARWLPPWWPETERRADVIQLRAR